MSKMLPHPCSDSTLKRLIASLVDKRMVVACGRGPATKYKLSPQALVTLPMDMNEYFARDVDDRRILEGYNFGLVKGILPQVSLFTGEEMARLEANQMVFKERSEKLSGVEYRKEMERLGIDLSWKSSQIEGNTYSLLETERLMKERIEASGKTREEAIMLLNHKDALDFLLDAPDYGNEINVRRVEDIHAILTKDLGVERHLRRHRVGITGTNYRPLDNEFQILEALEDSCALINGKKNVFEKALLVLVLLSYIQPFSDGNKRTARVVSNAVLIANGYCPIPFRTVDSLDYKKAMLVFYEQNNIAPFKQIFVEQFEFAVNTYF